MFVNSISRAVFAGQLMISLSVCYGQPEDPLHVESRNTNALAHTAPATGPTSDCPDSLLGDCPLGRVVLSDDQIDAFTRQLDPGANQVAARFKTALSTATGRLALAGCVADWENARRARWRQEAIREFFSEYFADNHGSLELLESKSWLPRWMRKLSEPYRSDMRELLPAIQDIARRVKPEGLAGRELKEFLENNAAPYVVYEALIRPLSRPDPLRRVLGKLFVTDDDGLLTVPIGQKKRAHQVFGQFLAGTKPFAKLKSQLPALGRDIAKVDPIHIRLARALREPLFAAHLAHERSKRSKAGRNPTPKKLMNRVVDDMNALLDRTPAGLRIKPPAIGTIQAHLDHFDTMHGSYQFAQKRIDRFVSSIAVKSGLRERWRDALDTELVAVWAADTDPAEPSDPLDILRNTTFLGTALSKDGARLRINPRLTALVQVRLSRLRTSLQERVQLVEMLDPFVTRIRDGDLQRVFQASAGRFFVAEWVRQTVADSKETDVRQWAPPCLDASAEVGQDSASEVESIIRASTAETPVLTIDVRRLVFDRSHTNLLKSSCFYDPRTAFDVHTYQTEFDGHYVGRIFGVFSLPARGSKNLEDFRTRLRSQREWLTNLARRHDRLVINISDTPRWLSRIGSASTDEAAFFYPPSNLTTWQTMVQDLVVFVRQCYSGPVYYEFWSEPDGRFLGTMEEFQSLYAATAKTIKKTDPRAKVGGAAVNHWNGTLRADRRHGAVNAALIQYAHTNGLPLDFISWHHFATDPDELLRAKRGYEDALRKAGFSTRPAFYLSEWNIPLNLRGSRYAAATAADYFVRFQRMKLGMQTVAAWVDFNPRPAMHDYSPYGLLTQQGYKRPEYFTHKLFDRMSRDSHGIATIEYPELGATAVVSQKGAGEYDILLWFRDDREPMHAVTTILEGKGISRKDLKDYGSEAQLMDAVLHVKPERRRWTEAFRTARDIFLGHRGQPVAVQLHFPGSERVHVQSAQSVTTSLSQKAVFAVDNKIAFDLRPFELCRIRVSLH